MKRNPINVIGTFESSHNWMTIVYLSEETQIISWHLRPIYYLDGLDQVGIPYEIVRINEHNDDRCWSCGVPVERGERFCNASCEKGAPQPKFNLKSHDK